MSLKKTAREVLRLIPELPPSAAELLERVDDAGVLSDLIASNVEASVDEKQSVLETIELVPRMRRVLELLSRQLEVLKRPLNDSFRLLQKIISVQEPHRWVASRQSGKVIQLRVPENRTLLQMPEALRIGELYFDRVIGERDQSLQKQGDHPLTFIESFQVG